MSLLKTNSHNLISLISYKICEINPKNLNFIHDNVNFLSDLMKLRYIIAILQSRLSLLLSYSMILLTI